MAIKLKGAVAISATFTSEPVTDSLQFWLQFLSLPLSIRHAPYNQIYQTLLDPAAPFANNEGGVNIILLRWQDLGAADQIASSAHSLIETIVQSAGRLKAPLLVVLCPSNPEFLANPPQSDLAHRLDQLLADSLKSPDLHLLSASDLFELYAVSEIHDPVSERLGEIPYTAEAFAAIGTGIARKILSLGRAPYKVAAVDLDNTMWAGVAGEDGAEGVRIAAPHLKLQEFLLDQRANGMLLAIVSKNNEEDAWAVFDRRPEMILKKEHFSAWRINWESKSANLSSLAGELSLGLSSFIFIDDDRKECAEVQARIPQILTLRLPETAEDIPRFLHHAWAFDRASVTAEDRLRGQSYRQERARAAAVESASSLESFIAALDLRVVIEPLQPSLLARAAQLTQRTNQFNTTTIRRTELEIRALLDAGQLHCITIAASDRFGNYGNVGAVFYGFDSSSLIVDSFMLSCRALGRGVEHQIVRYLGEEALKRGATAVAIRFVPSARNAPALRFLENIDAARELVDSHGELFRISAQAGSSLAYKPISYADVVQNEKPDATLAQGTNDASEPAAFRYAEIATRLNTAAAVMAEFRTRKATLETAAMSVAADPLSVPRTPVEEQLAGIWAEVLRRSNVGIHDDFFELGGDSLLGVELLMRVVETFDANDLTLSAIIEAPTAARFAQLLASRRSKVRCLVPIKAGGSRPPFFCVPGAGGNILSLRPLGMSLPGDLPLWCLQAPGLDGSDTIDNVPQIASLYIDEIRTVQSDGPYFLGGASYGGVIAFEMAQQLAAAGEEVAMLAMLDSYNLAYGQMIPKSAAVFYHARYFLQRLAMHLGRMTKRPAGEWPGYLSDRLRTLSKHFGHLSQLLASTPVNQSQPVPAGPRRDAGTEPGAVIMVLERVRDAMMEAVEKYVPRPYPGIITVFAAATGMDEPYQDKYRGWKPVAGRGIETISVPGDHDSIFDTGHELANALDPCLRRVTEKLPQRDAVVA